jgi:predicted MFS family arabinose efflux permease
MVRVWHIITLAALLGIANAFDMPCRQAFVIEMVGHDDLLNAVALNSTMFNAARIVGPAVAAILIGAVGTAACFYINGASFIAVIVGLAMMRIQFEPPPPKEESIFHDMLEGLSYIRHHTVILTIIAIVAVFSVFGMPYAMLMPVFAREVLHTGARGYGLLMTATGVGAVVGALTLATFSHVKQRGRLIVASSIVFIVFINLFAASRSLALAIPLLAVVGFTMVNQAAAGNALLQTLAPNDLRGRVMGVFSMMFLGFAPFGSFQAGLVAQHLGAPAALIIGSAVMSLTVALILILRPEIRNL